MAFALLSVVAGAPFVAMFTRIADGDVAFAATISLIFLLVTIPFMPLVLRWLLAVLGVPQTLVTIWHLLKATALVHRFASWHRPCDQMAISRSLHLSSKPQRFVAHHRPLDTSGHHHSSLTHLYHQFFGRSLPELATPTLRPAKQRLDKHKETDL
jgi:hypothetical protein